VFNARSKGLRRPAQDRWFKFSPARVFSKNSKLAAGRHRRGVQRILVGIKGPLTTPIGGGIRSLNVALRQMLDLYVCLRPCNTSPAFLRAEAGFVESSENFAR